MREVRAGLVKTNDVGGKAVGKKQPSWRKTWPPHPSADVFPMLPDDELRELMADIEDNGGLRELPVVWRDPDVGRYLLIDGRNRCEALERLGRPLPVAPRRFGPDEVPDPARYVISANVRRRHLSEADRVLLAARALEAGDEYRKSVSEKRGRGRPRGKVARVAEAADVTPPTARKYLRILDDPDLGPKVESGELAPVEAVGIQRQRDRDASRRYERQLRGCSDEAAYVDVLEQMDDRSFGALRAAVAREDERRRETFRAKCRDVVRALGPAAEASARAAARRRAEESAAREAERAADATGPNAPPQGKPLARTVDGRY
jgi:hypothetical protein